MKKEQGIILASFLGLSIAFGMMMIRKVLHNKNYEDYDKDHHRNFEHANHQEDHHGVEFLAFR